MQIPIKAKSVTRNDPKHAPKGGQFGKRSAWLKTEMQAEVRSPFDGKIAHIAKDKTHLDPKTPPPAGSFQFTIRKEIIVKGDRHLIDEGVAIARFVPVAGIGRHVKEGDLLGHVFEDEAYVAASKDGILEELGY